MKKLPFFILTLCMIFTSVNVFASDELFDLLQNGPFLYVDGLRIDPITSESYTDNDVLYVKMRSVFVIAF